MGYKTGIVIQARMGSTRLPGKAMLSIGGKPMLYILIERLKRCQTVDEIVVATTRNERDEPIVACARALDARVYRGDENDVLSRYYEAACEYALDTIVRITSDCPLSDPFIIDEMVRAFRAAPNVPYLSNTVTRTFPRGFDAEVFAFKVLEEAHRNAKEDYEREHVTPYIYRTMAVQAYRAGDDASTFRVTVDTAEDFRLVSEVFSTLGRLPFIRVSDVIALLRSRPDLVEINRHVQQKAAV
jgi:spore coat polysaccharide biosynthesis protein SpsF